MALTKLTWVSPCPWRSELSLSSAWGCWSLSELCTVSAGLLLEPELILWAGFPSCLQTSSPCCCLMICTLGWTWLPSPGLLCLPCSGTAGCTLARHGLPSAPGSPPLREPRCSGGCLTHGTEAASPQQGRWDRHWG